MGLTIHYELALSRDMTPKQVRAKVEALRQRCLDLPFKDVGPLLDLQGDACNYEKNQDENLRWLLIQGGKTLVRYHYTSKGTPRRGHVKDNSPGYANAYVQVFATRMLGFSTIPGEGCEPANFGLSLFPENTEIRGSKYPYANARSRCRRASIGPGARSARPSTPTTRAAVAWRVSFGVICWSSRSWTRPRN